MFDKLFHRHNHKKIEVSEPKQRYNSTSSTGSELSSKNASRKGSLDVQSANGYTFPPNFCITAAQPFFPAVLPAKWPFAG
ncbi:unnamed protein product [Caenorhabditis auriculariae]|uniref:Uncharacterized protein n=1 Tax=Caenorhabditis auriculariae TaxID=2777116 RepID=A0A8S1GPV8_9PELO|nr:unnamed protein product [Caenorhabditis auriculariae]